MDIKIIVTGGCGYIGSHTVVELLEHGYKVVVIDDLSNASKAILQRIKTITGKMPIFEQVDLKDANATAAVFKTHKDAKAVINFAAYKAVGESVEKPLMYYKNNLYVLLNVLSAQKEYGINGFIFHLRQQCMVYLKPYQLQKQTKPNARFRLMATQKKWQKKY
jgi:UDP-galactose 4-epimerase (EC 5.1.3.2)